MTAALFASGITAPQSQAAAAKAKKLSVSAAGKLYVGAYSPYTKTKLKVKVTPAKANQKVTFKSNNKKIATVSKKGVVKAKKKGKVKITVTTKAKNARGKKLKKTIKLNIKKYKAPTGINASISATNLNIGDTATITASLTGNPTKKTLVYTTSAAGVASVNNKGVVTAKAAGTATITVKSSVKGNKGKILSKSFEVTVNGGGGI